MVLGCALPHSLDYILINTVATGSTRPWLYIALLHDASMKPVRVNACPGGRTSRVIKGMGPA